jgi:hypothetical protein
LKVAEKRTSLFLAGYACATSPLCQKVAHKQKALGRGFRVEITDGSTGIRMTG